MTANPRLRAAIAVVVVAVALGLAWVLGRATRSDTAATPQPAGSSTPVVTPSSPTGTPTQTITPSRTPTPSTSSPTPRSAVDPGLTKDFGYTQSSKIVDGYVHLSFDRAILLTGKAANDYAAAHGMATPVPNDYLVVNDNKRLRDLVLAPDVKITGNVLLAGTGTSDPSPVSLAAFLAKIKSDPTIPVHISYDKYLLVTKIDEQFFP